MLRPLTGLLLLLLLVVAFRIALSPPGFIRCAGRFFVLAGITSVWLSRRPLGVKWLRNWARIEERVMMHLPWGGGGGSRPLSFRAGGWQPLAGLLSVSSCLFRPLHRLAYCRAFALLAALRAARSGLLARLPVGVRWSCNLVTKDDHAFMRHHPLRVALTVLPKRMGGKGLAHQRVTTAPQSLPARPLLTRTAGGWGVIIKRDQDQRTGGKVPRRPVSELRVALRRNVTVSN